MPFPNYMFKKNDLTWKPGNIARFDLPVASKLLKI